MLSSEKDRCCFDFGEIMPPASSPYGGQMIRCLETLQTKTGVKNFIDEKGCKNWGCCYWYFMLIVEAG